MEQRKLRIVLVGKTGVGKSATGNTILGKKVFKSQLSFGSQTEKCQKETGEVHGYQLSVVDTPGLYDTKTPHEEVVKEIAKCICLSAPGPHLILIVIQMSRFTVEEQKTVAMLQEMFGKSANKYTMVLITHGDELKKSSVSVDTLINGYEPVHNFISQCKGGYYVFDNEVPNESQVTELLRKINTMLKNSGGSYYSHEMFKEAEKAILEAQKRLIEANPRMSVKEARAIAEEDNSFINGMGICALTAAGAGGGAVAGGIPGAVVGTVGGFAVGLFVVVKNKKCVIQ